jgi:regulator of cell morphogenesis and NO signaling
MNLNAEKTVREFATEIPHATRIFEKFGIDYCCGGSKPLEAACRQANISLDEVLRCLKEPQANLPGVGVAPDLDLQNAPLAELIAHILAAHHGYVKHEVARIKQLLRKVVAVHSASHPELAAVQRTFHELADELLGHMMKEEVVLFPHIEKLEQAAGSGTPPQRAPFGSIRNPVRMMELEHASAGGALEQLRALTSSYTAPENACFSYKTLYAALQDFETDLHQHVHLENNILFPRAIALEGRS